MKSSNDIFNWLPLFIVIILFFITLYIICHCARAVFVYGRHRVWWDVQ